SKSSPNGGRTALSSTWLPTSISNTAPNDPAIVAATMAKPGVVLRRPVGSNSPFKQHAELPKELPIGNVNEREVKPRRKAKEPKTPRVGDKAVREAALAFEREREQKRRERARRKEEAACERERKRREQAVAKVERALEAAKLEHETKTKKIETDRAALDRRSQ